MDELEELYEEAKMLKSDGNLEQAETRFESILKEDNTKCLLRFRALKQLFKISVEQVTLVERTQKQRKAPLGTVRQGAYSLSSAPGLRYACSAQQNQ